ncbi:hypothetical protein DFA_04867 [Cavenderia fasciculata]|uniref:Ankyrin repeat-containing protein n=1 Tax=Cavenderia fasciculata TaxID=261658 RepID=F4PM34_CACFS|nr:uncharacterized protein DFA_04867 [Cavenderia fasciculata]EGG22737.1 hypothetical protein DFA_04867 [Cavenderia fasciculata]|eukprot:XP_004360588.1 hypothetical protein DFA_04867 [Cavenderia fasciculata]
MAIAAQYGHYEIVKFLFNNKKQEERKGGLLTAQQKDHIEEAIITASVCGHIAYVKYILSTFNITTLRQETVLEIKSFCQEAWHYEIIDYFESESQLGRSIQID